MDAELSRLKARLNALEAIVLGRQDVLGYRPNFNGNTSTFLNGANGFSVPAGSGGNVSGPGSSTDKAIVTWDGTGGTALLDNPNATLDGNVSQFLNRSGNFSVPSGGGGSDFFAAGVPTLASFTGVNTTGVTTTENSGKAITFSSAGSAGSNLALWTKAVPSTPYRIVTFLGAWYDVTSNLGFGIGYRDSVSGKIQTFIILVNTSATDHIATSIENWDSATSFNAGVLRSGADFAPYAPRCMAIEDDGTTVKYSFSVDGATWFTFLSVTKSGSFLGSSGYNQACIIVSTSNAGSTKHINGTLMLWDESGTSRVPEQRG